MIEKYSFGRMTVDGREYRKDLKIIQGRVVSDWWRKQGHLVDAADLEDVLSAKPSILVVGMGDSGLMKPAETLRTCLAESGMELRASPTAEALKVFNRLASEGENVAGAFHLTC
jgi:hypothetical protein